jgi:hypothetical protein
MELAGSLPIAIAIGTIPPKVKSPPAGGLPMGIVLASVHRA